MKKGILLITMMALLVAGAYAQEKNKPDYNKWSVEGGIGVNKAYHAISSGYRSASPSLLSGEIGARYMMNEYFGLKMGLAYDHFTEHNDTPDFSTSEYSVNLQGVINAGRILKFEDWTSKLNLLAHGGAGIGFLDNDNASYNDYIGFLMAGLTGEVKMSPRVALNLDLSGRVNFRQTLSFNGGTPYDKGQNGMVFNGTIGVSYYLGKNKEHADWTVRKDDYSDLYNQIAELENNMKACKKNDRGMQQIDELNRRLNDMDKKLNSMTASQPDAGDFILQMINGGYLNIYFEFNSTKIDKSSADVVNALRTYLKDNPGKQVYMDGYADEKGSEGYNMKLSKERAEAVAGVLTRSGIDASRIHAEGKGEDKSVDPKSAEARQLARRVSFTVR